MKKSLLVALVVLCGCYDYVAPRRGLGDGALVGRRVQITLTDSGSFAMAAQIGPQNDAIDGTVTADSARAYHMAVTSVRNRSGQEIDWRGEIVHVPHAAVLTVQERVLSKRRTTFASLVLAAGMAVAQSAFGGGGGATFPGPSPGPGGGPR